MTPLVVENEPPVTFLRRKMTGGRFSMGVVIRRYTGFNHFEKCVDPPIVIIIKERKKLENILCGEISKVRQFFLLT